MGTHILLQYSVKNFHDQQAKNTRLFSSLPNFINHSPPQILVLSFPKSSQGYRYIKNQPKRDSPKNKLDVFPFKHLISVRTRKNCKIL